MALNEVSTASDHLASLTFSLPNPPAHAESWNIKGPPLNCQNVLFSYKLSFCHLHSFYCLSQQFTAQPRSLLLLSCLTWALGPEESRSNKGRSFSLSADDCIISPAWTFMSITAVKNTEPDIKDGDILEQFGVSHLSNAAIVNGVLVINMLWYVSLFVSGSCAGGVH